MVRDSQREAVYTWERSLPWEWESGLRPISTGRNPETGTEFFDYRQRHAGPEMSLELCRELVRRAARRWRISCPRVLNGGGHRNAAFYDGHPGAIALPKWGRQPIVVLHEVAHAVLQTHCRDVAAHGPEFTTVCLDLWAAFIPGFDKVKARHMGREQRPRRVRFAARGKLPATQRSAWKVPPEYVPRWNAVPPRDTVNLIRDLVASAPV